MQHNVGGAERIARLGIGGLLALVGILGYAGYVDLAWVGIGQALTSLLVLLVGLILLVTGALSWCPINSLVGRNSDRTGTERARR